MLTRSVFERLRYEVSGLARRPFLAAHERKAKAYLEAEGVLALLRQGDASEIKAVFGDLAYLHRTVRRIRPTTVVEFGVGIIAVASPVGIIWWFMLRVFPDCRTCQQHCCWMSGPIIFFRHVVNESHCHDKW